MAHCFTWWGAPAGIKTASPKHWTNVYGFTPCCRYSLASRSESRYQLWSCIASHFVVCFPFFLDISLSRTCRILAVSFALKICHSAPGVFPVTMPLHSFSVRILLTPEEVRNWVMHWSDTGFLLESQYWCDIYLLGVLGSLLCGEFSHRPWC